MRDAQLAGLKDDGGYQKITAPSTSTALTVPPGAKYALIKTETQAIRWKAHRLANNSVAAPTTTDGMLIDIGDEFWFTGSLHLFRMIEVVAGAVVHVHYFT